MRKWLIRSLLVVVAVFVVLWATWPWTSQLTWLVPVEKELHSYMKKAQPVEQTILQQYDLLAKDPADREHVDTIIEQSEQLLAINERYWVEGKGQPWYRAFMYEIRGMEQPEDYLPTWPGPKDPEGKAMLVDDMRSDTGSLAVYAWNMKEAGNVLAAQMIETFGSGTAVTQETFNSTSEAVSSARAANAGVDFVYKKWKGNYRPPLSLFR